MSTVINYRELGGLIQQTFILLKFWRLNVQNRGADRAILILKALGENLFHILLVSGIASNPWHSETSRTFLKVSCKVKSETLSMNFHTVTLKYTNLTYILKKMSSMHNFLLMHDFVTSNIWIILAHWLSRFSNTDTSCNNKNFPLISPPILPIQT